MYHIFLKIHEIMTSLDQRKVIDYEEVQDQMKAIYRRLKKANKSKMEIFMEISNKVHGVTLQDDILSDCRFLLYTKLRGVLMLLPNKLYSYENSTLALIPKVLKELQ